MEKSAQERLALVEEMYPLLSGIAVLLDRQAAAAPSGEAMDAMRQATNQLLVEMRSLGRVLALEDNPEFRGGVLSLTWAVEEGLLCADLTSLDEELPLLMQIVCRRIVEDARCLPGARVRIAADARTCRVEVTAEGGAAAVASAHLLGTAVVSTASGGVTTSVVEMRW